MSHDELEDFFREAWRDGDSNYLYFDKLIKKIEGEFCVWNESEQEIYIESIPGTKPF